MRHRLIWLAAVAALGMPAGAQAPQAPWQGKNLQYFPKDITRDALVQQMRQFSFALGVRCEYCHNDKAMTPSGLDFAAFALDEKPPKAKARAMLRMVDQLNQVALAAVPSRAEPRVTVTCAICHRGLPLPKTLQTTLFEIVAAEGAAAAVARYRELRRDQALSGRYNFGEWEINELARRLFEGGNVAAAIAILEMNGEFNPKSAEIDFMLGELHLKSGDREKAAARYRAAIEKSPQHERAKQRLAEIDKK